MADAGCHPGLAGPLLLKKHAAHFVQVVGDDGVQTWPRAALVAPGDDGDAVPCLLRGELVARELGRQLAQFRWRAGHANHGVPAGNHDPPRAQEVCRAAIASLPAAALDVFHTAERDPGSRARTGVLANAYRDELDHYQKYGSVL
jgi:hypothetical protein